MGRRTEKSPFLNARKALKRPLRSSASGINCKFVIFDLLTILFFQYRAAVHQIMYIRDRRCFLSRSFSWCLRESRSLAGWHVCEEDSHGPGQEMALLSGHKIMIVRRVSTHHRGSIVVSRQPVSAEWPIRGSAG